MLRDLPLSLMDPRDPILAAMAGITGGSVKPVQLATGVYETHLNYNLAMRGFVIDEYPSFGPDGPDGYGVCDTWHQIFARWPGIIEGDPRTFVVRVTPFRKADQPAEGGWRWHKWGPYIGIHTPTTEYLHDEPLIDVVYCWHIAEVLPEQPHASAGRVLAERNSEPPTFTPRAVVVWDKAGNASIEWGAKP